jgi:hypothetical protein
MYVCIYIYIYTLESVKSVFESPLIPNNKATAKKFYINQQRCEVLTGYSSLGCRPGGEWVNT